MTRNSMHIFEISEHDLLILNYLHGECFAKNVKFFYLIIFFGPIGGAISAQKLTETLRPTAA